MSFKCEKHGWQHLQNVCPVCWQTQAVTTVGVSASRCQALKARCERYKKALKMVKQETCEKRIEDIVDEALEGK